MACASPASLAGSSANTLWTKEEPGIVFAAAVLAFDSGDAGRIRRVLEIGCLTPELQRELISALGWLPFSKMEAVTYKSFLVLNIRRCAVSASQLLLHTVGILVNR